MGRLYLLRHEQRVEKIDCYAGLTAEGIRRANDVLPEILQNLEIDEIYCSPFFRTLLTISPYCAITNSKVNIERAIAESINENCDEIVKMFTNIINQEYVSFISECEVEKLNPTLAGLVKRVSPFIDSLDDSKNILIVTHMPLINAIIKHLTSQYVEIYTIRRPGSITIIEF